MSQALAQLEESLRANTRTWLVTGAAGFIGSNLVERLLRLGQKVVALDNFSTGHRSNLQDVLCQVGPQAAQGFHLVEGDIRELSVCREACKGVERVLHQAALGSVPRSIEDPLASHQVNVDGTLNVLQAAREAGVTRLVFASSSSVYGDHPALPKVEEQIGRPLSPYAVTKRVDELYARTYFDNFNLSTVGLRYFNVFGRRQDPEGAYAAVIPRWIATLLRSGRCVIYGDGETSRDFCHVENVIQANLLAALAPDSPRVSGEIFNIAYSARTTLTELFFLIRDRLVKSHPELTEATPNYLPFRKGDIRHSHADISKAQKALGYAPTHTVAQGLDATMDWYLSKVS